MLSKENLTLNYAWLTGLVLELFVSDPDEIDSDVQFYVQHLIRKLGYERYIGQRILVVVSQKIYSVAETLLFSHPFDDNFPQMHGSMFTL